MRSGFRYFLVIGAVTILLGCARDYSPNTYSPGGMQQANKVERAVVQNVREVDVKDPSLGLGTAAGAAAGGIAGSQIGKGGGNAIATLGGVLIGGAIGWLAEQEANATTAYEYILEKPNGDLVTLAQKQEQPFAVGDHVFILYGVQARVIPDSTKGTGKAKVIASPSQQ
jgi:outer membrane lipoprotein SlyB